MGDEPEWRWFTFVGLIMVAQTMFDIAPKGPWDAASFTRGVIGLIGLCTLYLGWFRYTFKINGIIPSINRWENPQQTFKKVLLFGIICISIVIILINTSIHEVFPETTGMILLLIGSLAIMNAIYVWLVVNGPLKQFIEEE